MKALLQWYFTHFSLDCPFNTCFFLYFQTGKRDGSGVSAVAAVDLHSTGRAACLRYTLPPATRGTSTPSFISLPYTVSSVADPLPTKYWRPMSGILKDIFRIRKTFLNPDPDSLCIYLVPGTRILYKLS
jgi:hypothetical protein